MISVALVVTESVAITSSLTSDDVVQAQHCMLLAAQHSLYSWLAVHYIILSYFVCMRLQWLRLIE